MINWQNGKTPITETNMNKLVQEDIITDAYSQKTYAVGGYCIYDNVLYKCKTAITTGEAFNSSKWEQTSISKELSSRPEFEIIETW